MTEASRRKILIGAASLLAAPAIVRASSLMKVRPVEPSLPRAPMFVTDKYGINGSGFLPPGIEDSPRWVWSDPVPTDVLERVLNLAERLKAT